MNFEEWLKWANKNRVKGFGSSMLMPRLELMDGASASVQASEEHHCFPRMEISNGAWDEVEVFADREEEILDMYRDWDASIGYLYNYVPVEDMNNYCKIHGGIKIPENFDKNSISC